MGDSDGSRDGGRSVLDEVVRFNAGRKPKLVRIKLRRMDEDVFAFFRGTDHLFARYWPELRPPDAGPAVLVSGDLHLENFGAYRTDDSDFRFDINDFDEAVVAPCSLDLARCATSILLAAHTWGLTPIQANRMVLAFLEEYRRAVAEAVRTGVVGEVAPGGGDGPIRDLLGATMMGSQARLLDHQTRTTRAGKRRIRRSSDRHPAVSDRRAAKVGQAVESYGQSAANPRAYRVLDVTGRVAGVGSLGLRRYTSLVEGGGSPDGNRLLDVKEAAPSSVLGCAGGTQPEAWANEAARVVEAQRQLQAKPAVGLGTLEISGRWYRVRELIPDEHRSSLDRLQRKPGKLRRAVELTGRLTAWSQVRGGRLPGGDQGPALARWAAGAALDAVLAAAARYAERTRQDYTAFHREMATRRPRLKAAR
jgi:uncharacterized protein (DUF2252 family)